MDGRVEDYEIDLLDASGRFLRRLGNVEYGAKLTWNYYADTRLTGTLTCTYPGQVDDLLGLSVRIHYLSKAIATPDNPEGRLTLGTLQCYTPGEDVDDHEVAVAVDLLDNTVDLLDFPMGRNGGWASGTSALAAIGEVMAEVGVTDWDVDGLDPDVLLTSTIGYADEDTALKTANAILDACGFWAFTADPWGKVVSSRYARPESRPAVWEFTDEAGQGSHTPQWQRREDRFNIPNMVRTVQAVSDSDAVPLIGVAQDFDGPFGFNRRGRWVVKTVNDVAAAGDVQTVLNDIAWQELRSAQKTIETRESIRHPLIPQLALQPAVVTHRTARYPTPKRFMVTHQTVTCTPGELVESTLRGLGDSDGLVTVP